MIVVIFLLTPTGPSVFFFVLARVRPGSLNISKPELEDEKLTPDTSDITHIIDKVPSETIGHVEARLEVEEAEDGGLDRTPRNTKYYNTF